MITTSKTVIIRGTVGSNTTNRCSTVFKTRNSVVPSSPVQNEIVSVSKKTHECHMATVQQEHLKEKTRPDIR